MQLEIQVRKPKGVELTRELLDEAVRFWSIDGVAPRGMQIRIIDWSHPGRKKGKVSNQHDARLRFRGLLQSGRFTVRLRSR